MGRGSSHEPPSVAGDPTSGGALPSLLPSSAPSARPQRRVLALLCMLWTLRWASRRDRGRGGRGWLLRGGGGGERVVEGRKSFSTSNESTRGATPRLAIHGVERPRRRLRPSGQRARPVHGARPVTRRTPRTSCRRCLCTGVAAARPTWALTAGISASAKCTRSACVGDHLSDLSGAMRAPSASGHRQWSWARPPAHSSASSRHFWWCCTAVSGAQQRVHEWRHNRVRVGSGGRGMAKSEVIPV